MHPVPPSVDQLFSASVLNRVASAEEGSNPLVGTALVSMPWLVAFEGQDTVAYACAVAAEVAGGVVGVPHLSIAPCAPNQRFNTSDPALPASSESNTQNLAFSTPLTASLRPSAAEVTPDSDTTAQILEALRVLATWPRLRNAGMPDPIVGGLELDPTGVSDRLGIKGLSVYTAFIEGEFFRCRVCGERANGMSLALLHQRHRRHFQQ